MFNNNSIEEKIDELHSLLVSSQEQQKEILCEQTAILKHLQKNAKNALQVKILLGIVIIVLVFLGLVEIKDAIQTLPLLLGLG